MRIHILFIFVLIVLLVPACILSAPGDDAPISTPNPHETQAFPTGSIPTEYTSTLPSPTETALPEPSLTLVTVPTQIPAPNTPTETPLPLVRFYMQPGTPIWITNFVKPEAGCNWMGLAGQVFDFNGNPMEGAVIEVGGTLEGQPIQQIALTGSASIIGPGGYVIELSNHPVQSDGTIWFQLLDQGGNAKTGRILLTTSGNCEENLTLINLIEANPIANQIRLPVILNSSP